MKKALTVGHSGTKAPSDLVGAEAKTKESLKRKKKKQAIKLVLDLKKKYPEASLDEIKEAVKEYLIKSKKPFPVGTIRQWGEQKYVKQADGWVVVGGEHHGKYLGKFKEEATQKEFASKYLQDGVNTEKLEPRKEANEARKEEANAEYVFARESTIPNKGEDIKMSARHKRNMWRGLDEAEKDGTADKFLNIKELTKNEPLDFQKAIDDNVNPVFVLTSYLILKKFPSSVNFKRLNQWQKAIDDGRYVLAQDLNMNSFRFIRTEDLSDTKKRVDIEWYKKHKRREYLDIYNKVKKSIEEALVLSRDKESPEIIFDKVRLDVMGMVQSLRKDDYYSDLANDLAGFYSSLRFSKYSRPSSRSVLGMLGEFSSIAKEKQLSVKEIKNAIQNIVLNHKGIREALDARQTREDAFNPTDAYVSFAIRKGPETPFSYSTKDQEKFLLNSLGLRGLQWGNSVSDEERLEHLRKSSEAFYDLTKILDLPEQLGSFNGRLGLAIGARGKKGALAHYEPDLQVINITRKNGVGSLAHEWGHFFDNICSLVIKEEKTTGASLNFISENASYLADKSENEGIKKSVEELRQSFMPYIGRMRGTEEFKGRSNKGYWLSTREVFARCFERYVSEKLKANGQENTYLVGLEDNQWTQSLWPNSEENKTIGKAFDNFLSVFKNSGYLKKAIDLLQNDKDLFKSVLHKTKLAYPDMEMNQIVWIATEVYKKALNKARKQFTTDDALRIGKKLNVNWQEVSLQEFTEGLNVELEHGTVNKETDVTDDSEIKTAKIALAHIREDKKYYTKLLEANL